MAAMIVALLPALLNAHVIHNTHIDPVVRQGTRLLPAPIMHDGRPLRRSQRQLTEVATLDKLTIRDIYIASEEIKKNAGPNGWTGSIDRCEPGDITESYRAAAIARINMYRQIARLDNVSNLAELSTLNQWGAMISAANNNLNHYPNSTAQCFTTDGYNSNANSNIALGNTGYDAVDAFIDDRGAGNEPVGHRRWLLYPPLTFVGSGDSGDSRWRGTSNGVKTNNIMISCDQCTSDGRAAPPFVAWPPAGFVPNQLVPSSRRWSLSMTGQSFAGAAVTINGNISEIISAHIPGSPNIGDPTLVFEGPAGATSAPEEDVSYEIVVTVGGSVIASYTVIVFDAIGVGAACTNLTVISPDGPAILTNMVFNIVHGGRVSGKVYYEADVPPAYARLLGSDTIYLYFADQWWWIGAILGQKLGVASVGDDAARPQDITAEWRKPNSSLHWIPNPEMTLVGGNCLEAIVENGFSNFGFGGSDGEDSDDGWVIPLVIIIIIAALVLGIGLYVWYNRMQAANAVKARSGPPPADVPSGTLSPVPEASTNPVFAPGMEPSDI